MSNSGDFKIVRGRNNRRKQAKVGRFDKEKYTNYKISETEPEYDFPKVRKSELKKLKAEIRAKIKQKIEGT